MKANSAFTLIEILSVVIIIGIVSALAAPNFSKGYSRFQLNQTADDLMSVSRWAQAMAIGQRQIYALSFSVDRRSYGLAREDGTLGRTHTIPDMVRLDSENDRIAFYPDGTIDPATIRLASPGQKTVLSSTKARGMMVKVKDE